MKKFLERLKTAEKTGIHFLQTRRTDRAPVPETKNSGSQIFILFLKKLLFSVLKQFRKITEPVKITRSLPASPNLYFAGFKKYEQNYPVR